MYRRGCRRPHTRSCRPHDANRRRIFLIVQRILIWLAIALVIASAFAPELSSLATFLGLLTAGVAVALQNVILAVVGYFLLVGKLGIRVGDRVRISGVTGDVIEVGLLQFQLREVDQNNEQLTGNVATFSNSFVFVSPATGLFKSSSASGNAKPREMHDNHFDRFASKGKKTTSKA
jgi:small-conductance mechanosensitive channel